MAALADTTSELDVADPELSEEEEAQAQASVKTLLFEDGSNTSALRPLRDRVFLVTGSTTGIGRRVVDLLVQKGCGVLVHGKRAHIIKMALRTLCRRHNHNKLDGFKADFGYMKEVREMGEMLRERHPRIDGILHNAACIDGYFTGERQISREQNEVTLAVNVLAPYVLTAELWDCLRASGCARVVFTTSRAMNGGRGAAGLDDLQTSKSWTGNDAYCLSKLCDAMLAMEMHKRYGDPPRMVFHAVDPGQFCTQLARHGASWGKGPRKGRSFQKLTYGTLAPLKQCNKTFDALIDDDLQFVSGKVLCPEVASEVYDDALRAKLWQDLEEITGTVYPAPTRTAAAEEVLSATVASSKAGTSEKKAFRQKKRRARVSTDAAAVASRR